LKITFGIVHRGSSKAPQTGLFIDFLRKERQNKRLFQHVTPSSSVTRVEGHDVYRDGKEGCSTKKLFINHHQLEWERAQGQNPGSMVTVPKDEGKGQTFLLRLEKKFEMKDVFIWQRKSTLCCKESMELRGLHIRLGLIGQFLKIQSMELLNWVPGPLFCSSGMRGGLQRGCMQTNGVDTILRKDSFE